jgi:glutamate-1-semialdehyde 2,1-aminomutase
VSGDDSRASIGVARRCAALAVDAAQHFPGAVPMHWMTDWGTPFPLFVAAAQGAELEDVGGHQYRDF